MNPREEGIIARPADINQLDFDMLKSPIVQAHDWGIPDPYDWQLAIWWACWKPGAMVAVRTANEAQPAWERVLMADNSWKRIDELKRGMMISSPQRGHRQIVGLSKWRQSAVFRVEMEDGGKCFCTDDHLWMVQIKTFSAGRGWREFEDTMKLSSMADFLEKPFTDVYTPEYGKGLPRKIKQVKFHGFEMCRCLKVDDPDGLYVTSDYIVTHNSGKTSVCVPVLALAFASAFPGAQVVITSASERQLEKQLMPSLENMTRKRKGWKKTGYTVYAPSIDGLPPSEIVCFATKSGDLFEGFHPRMHEDDNGNLRYCPLLIIADEAKSIKQDIFTAIERCNPTVELRISTCGEDSGGFYDACENEDGLWTTGIEWRGRHIEFVIPWDMCPHLLVGHTLARKMAMMEKYGPSHPTVRSILLAEFFRGGTQMVFSEADMAAILECMSGLIPHIPGQRRAFCDLSGGGDELTFQLREGNQIHPVVAWNADSTTPPSVTADKYIRLFRLNHLRPDEIYADNGGLGAQIINELAKKKWNITRINNGAGPKDAKMYVTRYAELHWEFKDLIHDQKLLLAKDDKLLKQARLRRFTMKNDDSNRITLEKKDAARKRNQEDSPDRLDTIMGLLIGIEQLPGKEDWKGNTRHSLCGTPKQLMAKALAEADKISGDDFSGGWDGA